MGRLLLEEASLPAAPAAHTPTRIHKIFGTLLVQRHEAADSSLEDCIGSWPGRAIRPAAKADAPPKTVAMDVTQLSLSLSQLVLAGRAEAPRRVIDSSTTGSSLSHTPAWLRPSFSKIRHVYHYKDTYTVLHSLSPLLYVRFTVVCSVRVDMLVNRIIMRERAL